MPKYRYTLRATNIGKGTATIIPHVELTIPMAEFLKIKEAGGVELEIEVRK